MLTTLYKPFQFWSEKGTIWIISDPHFSDPEMVYLRKNYIGDEDQIKRINSKVGKNDTLIILGDIGNIECVKQLKGYKILIIGNHDSGSTNYIRVIKHIKNYDTKQDAINDLKAGIINVIDEITPNCLYAGSYDNKLFDEVYEGPLFISEKLLLSHEPIQLQFAFNIHGHDHSNWSNELSNFNHLNVCAEHINYTPVNLTSLLKKGLCSNVKSIHRITTDTATKRKNSRKELKSEK